MTKTKPKSNGKHPSGRPPKPYESVIFPSVVRMLKRRDATDEEVATALVVSVDTIYRWRDKYPPFCEALKESRQVCHGRLTDSLFDMANGYTYTEDAVTKDGEIVQVTKYVPKNPTMGIYLAGNLLGLHDVRRHEMTGKGGEAIKIQADYSQVSDEDARRLIAAAEKLVDDEEKKQLKDSKTTQ